MTDYGECTITRFEDGQGEDRLRIDRADERIRISPDLLDEVVRSDHPDITLTEDVLQIVAVNRIVRYRLGELTLDQHDCLWRLAERIDP
jgi:hypothetical protein